jgi:hypothetical protein
LYAYYDVSYQQLSIEATVSETFTASNNIPLLGKLDVTPSLYAGYSHIGDLTPKGTKIEDGYTYLGGAIALSANVYGFDVSVGPRYVVTDDAEFGSAFNNEFQSDRLSWFVQVGYDF